MLLVDSSGSMRYGSRSFEDASGAGHTLSPDGRSNWSKFDHATAIAAAMAYITLHQGDRAGLVVFADQVQAMVKRSSSQGTWRQVVGGAGLALPDGADRGPDGHRAGHRPDPGQAHQPLPDRPHQRPVHRP
jgi:uncharacterized protein (DUF58 family)